LTSKKDRSSQHTLNDFTANALVKALYAFFFQDSQETIKGGFIFQSISGTSLEAAFYDTSNRE
jgi:hypothetical protein